MEFSEFAGLPYPIIGGGDTTGRFTRKLFEKITDIPVSRFVGRGFPASCGRGGIAVWSRLFPFGSGCIFSRCPRLCVRRFRSRSMATIGRFPRTFVL